MPFIDTILAFPIAYSFWIFSTCEVKWGLWLTLLVTLSLGKEGACFEVLYQHLSITLIPSYSGEPESLRPERDNEYLVTGVLKIESPSM